MCSYFRGVKNVNIGILMLFFFSRLTVGSFKFLVLKFEFFFGIPLNMVTVENLFWCIEKIQCFLK